MEILEGGLPEGQTWRLLVLLTPATTPDVSAHIARMFADAHGGEVVCAVLLTTSDEASVAGARDVIGLLRNICKDSVAVHSVIALAPNSRRAAAEIVHRAAIDLVLLGAGDPRDYQPDKLPCSVAVIYEKSGHDTVVAAGAEFVFDRILVPTSGGPNTAEALRLLLPLSGKVEVCAAYVAVEDEQENQSALGRARLRQLMTFIDGTERFATDVIEAPSVVEGILQASQGDFKLVIIGATGQGRIDLRLFGNVPAAVLQRSDRPVMVFYENAGRFDSLANAIAWRLQHVVPRQPVSERTDVYVRVRKGARPTFDYYLMITLSTLIAALGLLLDSGAVVIGAMLVAPLMSPILGVGMAMVLGDIRFLRLASEAVIRGVLAAIGVGVVVGLLALATNLEPLTGELLSRTRPGLLDLGIALFAGMAGAYAISRSEMAAALPGVAISAALVPPLASVGIALATGHFGESARAALLFTTNLVAIGSAAVLIFLVLGYRPTPTQKGRKAERLALQQRSARIAVITLVAVAALLVLVTTRVAETDRLEQVARTVVNRELANIVPTAQLMEPATVENDAGDGLVRLNVLILHDSEVDADARRRLAEVIGAELGRPVQLDLRVVTYESLPANAP